MVTANELLASMTEVDRTFVIDNDLRTIKTPASITNLGVQSDDDVMTVYFQMPGTYCGIDLSEFNIRINYLNGAGEGDYHDVGDAAVQSDGTIRFSWTIGRHAASVVGNVEFNVCMKKSDSSGNVIKEFNTTTASLPILKGLEVSEQVISEYNDILEQWRAKLFGVGDTEEARLLAVSQEQQQVISEQSATILSDIELKGSETLATIPDTYTEVYNMAEEALRTKADAIVLEAEGIVITLNDSSDDHLQNLKVFGKTTQVKTTGKNLIPATLLGTITQNGVTFMPEYNSDGQLVCITANGTAGEQSYVTVASTISLPEGEYILSGCPSGGSTTTHDIRFNGVNARDYGSGVKFAITSESVQNSISCVVAPGATANNLKFYPMIRLASVNDSTFEPYSGGVASPSPDYPQLLESVEKPTVTVQTRNLFNGEMSTCAFSGNVAVFNDTYRGFYLRVEPEKTYTVSRNAITSNRFQIMFTMNEPVDNEKVYNRVPGDDALSITAIAPNNCKWLMCYLSNAGEDVSNTLYQVEEGSVVHPYEPYVEPQSFTLDRTLHGIPVSDGGNYTDENGQQWICDEVDFNRGVYVQRTKSTVLDGSSDEIWSYNTNIGVQKSGLFTVTASGITQTSIGAIMCENYTHPAKLPIDNCEFWGTDSYFGISQVAFRNDDFSDVTSWRANLAEHPISMLYALKTPIETPLTSEEILAYKKLKTNRTNTTVLNDQNARMAIAYSADTLTFLRDNQPKPTDEQVEAAVNEYADEHGVQVPTDEHITNIVNTAIKNNPTLTDAEIDSLMSSIL